MSLVAVSDAQKVTEVTIDDFFTLAAKTRGELLQPKVGFKAENLRYTEETGSLVKRKARAKYGGMDTLGTSAVTHAVRYYKATTGGKKLVIAYSTTLKVGTDSDGTFANIATGLTTDLHYTSVVFKDLLYLANGTDAIRVYDGTNNAETIGVPTPTAPTLALGAAGGLNGTYLYKVAYEIDTYQEGNASVASASIAPVNQRVTVTIPTSSNTRVTKRHIYRTTAGGSVYNFLATVSDNTTTTYDDNVADGSLTTTRTAASDYGGPAEDYRYLVLHKNRLHLLRGETNKSRGAYSDIRSGTAYPDVYPAANVYDIRKDDGAEITLACEDALGQLIVGKANGIVRIATDTDSPTGWSGFQQLLSTDGCVAPFGWASTPAGVIYVSGYGESKLRLMRWNGQRSEPFLEEFWPILDRVPKAVVDEIVGHTKDGFFFLAYRDPDAGTETYNNQLLIVTLATGQWVVDDKNVECFSNWNYVSDSGELYTGTADTTGLVLREDTLAEDIIIDSEADLDEGTHSQTDATADDRLTLIQAQLQDDIGATTISAATGTISGYTGDLDTIAPSGTWISKIFEINAQRMVELLWNEVLGDNGEVLFWVRTAETSAGISSASWQGSFTTPGGSDLSAVETNQFVQIRVKLYVKNADSTVSQAPNVYLRLASGYIIKLSVGGGTLLETTIPMAYESQWLDFGWVHPGLKARQKWFQAARVYFSRARATGSLDFRWRVDQQASTAWTTKTWNFSSVATKGVALYRFPIYTRDAVGTRLKFRLEHDDDIYPLTVTKVVLTFVAQPFNRFLEV